jgi:molecular chaperone GrpE
VRDAFKEERAEVPDPENNSSDDDGTDAVVEAAEPPQEDELTVATRERDEYLDLAKRTQADFENFRKRTAKDLQAAGTRARVGLIREILPVVDNLERALSVAPVGEGDAFVEGVRLVYRELEGALARAGVEAIEPKGDPFDPNVHEALSVRPQEGAESGTVVDVVEKGYRTADTVVRPARVVVAS